jgi:16S rRNA (adenine(1408)-N(1))-methyltransferase
MQMLGKQSPTKKPISILPRELERELPRELSRVMPLSHIKQPHPSNPMIKLLQGNQWVEMAADPFQQLRGTFASTLVDLGTGDGKFPYMMAKETPSLLCLGVDAQTASLAHFSWKAARKPAKGGLSTQNLFYIQAALPDLPHALVGTADIITIRLPWAGLLREAITPSAAFLEMILKLARPNAWLVLQLNMSIFEDEAYLEKLSLPRLNQAYLEETLKPCYQNAGFTFWDAPPPPGLEPFLKPTSWQQRLRLGNQRRQTKTLILKIH